MSYITTVGWSIWLKMVCGMAEKIPLSIIWQCLVHIHGPHPLFMDNNEEWVQDCSKSLDTRQYMTYPTNYVKMNSKYFFDKRSCMNISCISYMWYVHTAFFKKNLLVIFILCSLMITHWDVNVVCHLTKFSSLPSHQMATFSAVSVKMMTILF